MKVRTRFAPSPTGYLHIGGARTALFNFLYARHYKGQFILRIEDTDKQRSTPEATDAILNGMRWLGLTWDEGPFLQSARGDHYKQAAAELLSSGHAYYCDCSVEALDEKRKLATQQGRKPMYDGTCRERNLRGGASCVIRFKAPSSGTTVVNDLVKGDVVFENRELDDMILVRADGSPTYNFVVVVDDIEMKISHIIRGDDHLNNTPKQIQLYQALKTPLPFFAHVPLILGEDKSRLSKRHGATSLDNYRDAGFLPEAMLNFLARLGWSHGDEEIFTLADLIQKFDLQHVGKSAGVFKEEKLLWLNHHYLRHYAPETLTAVIKPFLEKSYGSNATARLNSPQWLKLLPELQERCKTIEEYGQAAHYFWVDEMSYDSKAVAVHLQPAYHPALSGLRNALASLQPFDEPHVEEAFTSVLNSCGLKMKELAQSVRVALTGTTISPGIHLLIVVLGKERVLQRLDRALAMIEQGEQR